MPTLIGGLFLVASVYCFFQNDDKLFALLIFSTLFQASSVVALSAAGVEPYYLVGAFFVLQGGLTGKSGFGALTSFHGKRWMILFAVIAISSAFTLPFVFAGTPVYEQHVGIDEGFFYRPPLHFANANLTRSLSLLLGVLVVLGAAERFRQATYAKAAYRLTFYFLAGTVIVQFLCSMFGVEFPYSLLQNRGGMSAQLVESGNAASRFAGTFTESSGAGEVLAGFTAGFLAEYLRFGRSLIPALVGLAVMFLVRSSGAMLAISVTLVLLLLTQPVFRLPFYIRISRFKRVCWLTAIGSAVLVTVLFSPLRDSLISMTVDKQETGSFINRLAADAFALDLFVKTNGIGVGMGSNRPSSLVTSLLSTVGIVGFAAFLLAYFKLLSNAPSNDSQLRWAGFALFLAMATSAPDYDTSWHWVFLAFVVQTGIVSSRNGMPRGGSPPAVHSLGTASGGDDLRGVQER